MHPIHLSELIITTHLRLANIISTRTKQINKQQLAELAHLGNAESSGRAWRRIEAKIKEAPVESTTGPGTPANGKGGDDAAATAAAAAAAAADPDSPSVLASDKKKNKKKAAGGGKATGSKRTKKEADDGGSGDEDENEGGERPKKIPKHVRGKPVVTLKKLEATQGLDDDFDEV